jgi:aminoglycoside phosphotransferase (APT) family kinase protein
MTIPKAQDVLPRHKFDEAALFRYLTDHLADFREPARVRQFQGGQSNPTFLIESADRSFVLRKQPPGQLLASAHAIDREYRVQAALHDTPVPTIAMRHFCADPAVIGTPFYVMDYVPGRIFFNPALPDSTPKERRALYLAMAETLAKLHEVDFRAIGLADYGRAEGYAARQVKRWSEQYEASKTDHIEAMDKLIGWLKANIPEGDEAAIVHGDYKLNNIMFELDDAFPIAVLDWELSTLGHPLADLGYLCMGYRIPHNLPMLGGLSGVDVEALGIPTEAEMVEAYSTRAGRDAVPDMTFFIAFSFFRFAAIAQGVYARSMQGNAADSRAHLAGQAAVLLAEEGWKLVKSA